MYISKIAIKNFRSFLDTEVLLHEGVNVLIGHNNAGKSNLLRALGLIFDSSSSKRLDVDDFSRAIPVSEYYALDTNGALLKSSPPSIRIAVTLTESTGIHAANEISPDDNNTIFDWRISIDTPYEAQLTYEFFLPEGPETKQYQADVKRLVESDQIDDASYWRLIKRKYIHKYIARIFGGDPTLATRADSEMLNRFDFQYLDAMRDAERYLFTGKNTLLKDVLHYFLDDDIKASTDKTAEEKAAEIERRNVEFQQKASDLIGIVKNRVNENHILDYSRDVGASVGGDPSFEGETSEIELFTTLRLIVRNAFGVTLPATHNGLGYNNLIYISVLLAKMQMSASGYGNHDDKKVFPMLVIEEPEAHLHPAMQFKLLKFLKQNIREKKQARQVFVTTHSTHITAAVELDEVICLNVDEAGTLQVAYPGKVFDPSDPSDVKSKAYVKRFLDATKSDMLFAKRVVMVEGIAEQLLTSCLVEYLESGNLEDQHISVVNVGGRYFQHFLKLFDYDSSHSLKQYAIKKRIVCITDADPTRKKKSEGRFHKCYPFDLGVDTEDYEYKQLSTTFCSLANSYQTHPTIRVFGRSDGLGKTFEYDLAFANPKCEMLISEQMAMKDELTSLMKAYREGKQLAELLAISTTTSINEKIASCSWNEDDAKRALIAARYLISIENAGDGGKGAHALELAYVLHTNRASGNSAGFVLPEHLKDAFLYILG